MNVLNLNVHHFFFQEFEFSMKEGNFRQIGNPSGRVYLLENQVVKSCHQLFENNIGFRIQRRNIFFGCKMQMRVLMLSSRRN